MPTGSNMPCIDSSIKSAWRAFWKHVACLKARNTPFRLRAQQLDRCVKPILSFRWSRWAFTSSTAHRIDQLQRKMLRILFKPRKLCTESPEQYCGRTAKFVSGFQAECGSWSAKWAISVTRWAVHIIRNTNKHFCCHQAFKCSAVDGFSFFEV